MRLNFWNVILSLFYALLIVVSIGILSSQGRIFYTVPVRDLVLMALAIYRLIRLFTYDKITQFIRDWFVGAREGTLRHALGVLINCPWCTGLWFSWVIVTFYFSSVYSWPVILILSLASLASFFQVLSNWVGWNAERAKLEVQNLTH
ncbi:MAG: sporulation protein [Parcubacteria group bacterium]|nr:sporulation protein [Parcubacteria group bacterium]